MTYTTAAITHMGSISNRISSLGAHWYVGGLYTKEITTKGSVASAAGLFFGLDQLVPGSHRSLSH